MKVFCTDGTTVECEAFRALDAGILLFEEEPGGDEAHDEATGFVPLTQIKYVLPEGVQPGPGQRLGEQQAETMPSGPALGAATGGQTGGNLGPGAGQGGGGRAGGPGGTTSGSEGGRRRR